MDWQVIDRVSSWKWWTIDVHDKRPRQGVICSFRSHPCYSASLDSPPTSTTFPTHMVQEGFAAGHSCPWWNIEFSPTLKNLRNSFSQTWAEQSGKFMLLRFSDIDTECSRHTFSSAGWVGSLILLCCVDSWHLVQVVELVTVNRSDESAMINSSRKCEARGACKLWSVWSSQEGRCLLPNSATAFGKVSMGMYWICIVGI